MKLKSEKPHQPQNQKSAQSVGEKSPRDLEQRNDSHSQNRQRRQNIS